MVYGRRGFDLNNMNNISCRKELFMVKSVMSGVVFFSCSNLKVSTLPYSDVGNNIEPDV